MRLKRTKRKQGIIFLCLVLLLLISVGYASLSTTLTINGITNVSQASWLVYFSNIVLNDSNTATQIVEPVAVGKTTTTINWEVSMDEPGQVYEFTVDVVNEGTIDAMIETATENMITNGLTSAQKKYLEYTITYENDAIVEKNDKLAAGETKTLKVRLEFKSDAQVEDFPQDAENISLSYSINYIQADSNAVTKLTSLPPEIGDEVNYVTTLNGVTLGNWEVFYVDGDYTYIILEDYMPNSAIDTSKTCFNKLSKNGNYSIYVAENESGTDLEKRSYLINTMREKSNWDELLTGTINGRQINQTRSENVFAMGAPSLELWKTSWNETYPEDKIYTKYAENLGTTNYDGWYVGFSENPDVYSSYVASFEDKAGYDNTLYFPHKEEFDSNRCFGYWLADPSAYVDYDAMRVRYVGYISTGSYHYNYLSARPVISLPTNILN